MNTPIYQRSRQVLQALVQGMETGTQSTSAPHSAACEPRRTSPHLSAPTS